MHVTENKFYEKRCLYSIALVEVTFPNPSHITNNLIPYRLKKSIFFNLLLLCTGHRGQLKFSLNIIILEQIHLLEILFLNCELMSKYLSWGNYCKNAKLLIEIIMKSIR